MNTRKIVFMALAFTLASVSCKRKDAPTPADVKYTGNPMVNFNNYGGYERRDVEIADKWIGFDYEVKLSNTTEPAQSDIKVTIQKDDNPLGEYNTLNGTNFVTVPINAFKIENPVITIPKGSRRATFHFEVNPAKLNLSNSYAFGFSILSVSGGGAVVNINDEETRMMVELGTLNDYDGVYNMYSFFSHPTNAALVGMFPFAPGYYEEMTLVTAGSNSVDMTFDIGTGTFITQMVINSATPAYTYFTGVNPQLVVNPANNAVTVVPTTAAGYASIAFLQDATELSRSKYYPTGIAGVPASAGKKTIVAHFRWNSAGGDRVARDTFVFVRKRP